MASKKTDSAARLTAEEMKIGIRYPSDQDLARGNLTVVLGIPSTTLFEELEIICNSPDFQAWHRITSILKAARNDPVIQASGAVVEWIDGMVSMTKNALNQDDLDVVMHPFIDAVGKEKSKQAGKHAKTKGLAKGRDKVKDCAIGLYRVCGIETIDAAADKIWPDVKKYADKLRDENKIKYTPTSTNFRRKLGDWVRQEELKLGKRIRKSKKA